MLPASQAAGTPVAPGHANVDQPTPGQVAEAAGAPTPSKTPA